MEELMEAAEHAARSARRAAILALFALGVALLVLAIDNGIKRGIVEEAQRARGTLDEIKAVADGVKTSGQGADPARSGVDAADGVGDPAPAHPAANAHAGGRVGAAGKRAARPTAGPRGHE